MLHSSFENAPNFYLKYVTNEQLFHDCRVVKSLAFLSPPPPPPPRPLAASLGSACDCPYTYLDEYGTVVHATFFGFPNSTHTLSAYETIIFAPHCLLREGQQSQKYVEDVMIMSTYISRAYL